MVPDLDDVFGFIAKPFQRLAAFLLALGIGGVVGVLPGFLCQLLTDGIGGLNYLDGMLERMNLSFLVAIPVFLLLVGVIVIGWQTPWVCFAGTCLMGLISAATYGPGSLLFALIWLIVIGFAVGAVMRYQQARWLMDIEMLRAENIRRRAALKERGIATFDPELD